MKQYLHTAIAEDNTSGAEFFLASIVQDAVIHECFETEDAEDLKSMAHRAARLAITGVNESMGINSFIVCETVRGVIHGLVALGGSPSAMTRETIRGICMESKQNVFPIHEIMRGVFVGVKMTAHDLGIDENDLQAVVNSEISAFFMNTEDSHSTVSVYEYKDTGEVVNLTNTLEEEIELLINKSILAHRKRPYIRYNHGRIHFEN